jgi:hypothetical protein
MTYENMPVSLIDKPDLTNLHISWRATWCKEEASRLEGFLGFGLRHQTWSPCHLQDANGFLEKSLGNHILGFYESHVNLPNQRAHMRIAKT